MVFGWLGRGRNMKNSLFSADHNAVVGGTMLTGVIYSVLTMLSNMICTLVARRTRERK
jgi:peptide/nickel transport system permease protein